MSINDIHSIAVAISAVVATVTFLIAVAGQFRARRENAVGKWQRALIQQIFQNVDDSLSFDDIAQRYRNEAVAYRQYNLQGEDLSPQTLRLILTTMVTDGIVHQRGKDHYALSTPQSPMASMRTVMQELQGASHTSMSENMTNMISSMMANMRDLVPAHQLKQDNISQYVFNIISDEPFRYTVSDMAIKTSQYLNFEVNEVRAQILQMLAKKWLTLDDKARLGMGVKPDVVSLDEED
jgi:hypothetical protein